MNRKITDQGFIDTMEMMLSSMSEENRQKTIRTATRLSNVQLTADFVRKFYRYITPEDFTLSYKLSYDMIQEFPNLFDEEILIRSIEYNSDDDTEDEENAKPKDIEYKLTNLNISVISEYETVHDKIFNLLYGDELIDFAINIIREATIDELVEYGTRFINIDETIDKIIMTRLPDEERTAVVCAATSLSEMPSSYIYQYVPNDIKEEQLSDGAVDPKKFVKTISESPDLGWELKIIRKAINGEIQLTKSKETFDSELSVLFTGLPETNIVEFFKLREYMPNAFSYSLLNWLLKNKSFTEAQLIEISDVFVSAGLMLTLRKYALNNEFNELADKLIKKDK